MHQVVVGMCAIMCQVVAGMCASMCQVVAGMCASMCQVVAGMCASMCQMVAGMCASIHIHNIRSSNLCWYTQISCSSCLYVPLSCFVLVRATQ